MTLTLSRRPAAYVADDLGGLLVERPTISGHPPPLGRDSRELLSAMAPLLRTGAGVLELGCGPRDQFEEVQHHGWRYVGADYDDDAADILCDAHALPFRARAFDAILAYAVLEHLYHPYLALHEIRRVLKPGGVFCGTVSQGEPFHSSFFNMTSWGLLSLFESSDMELLRLWPSHDTLFALAEMGHYPRIIKALLRGIASVHEWLPFLAPRRMRWPRRQRVVDELHRSASICFLARKHA